MILILSEENDHTTNDVIDWLLLWKHDFLRINDTDVISIMEIKINQNECDIFFKINASSIIYSVRQFTAYWYRRGDIILKSPEYSNQNDLNIEINSYLKKENMKIREFFLKEIEKIPNKIGSIFELNNNKLTNLVIAAKVGLKIPATSILTEKHQIEKNIKTPHISKAIYNNFDLYKPNYHISTFTSLINKDLVINENVLFPSLIQEFIDKLIDIRIFYLKKNIWSAAIFSQNDDKTKTDYRNYNDEKPNRIEVIELPDSIKNKIIDFMTTINMNCGSLDFALSKNNEYCFFEVNPVGQFGAISVSCGFNIEKIIAKELSKNI